MRIFFILSLCWSFPAMAQFDPVAETKAIALMEQQGHHRLGSVGESTLASDNFDVKYYRCEWEVDPAVRFIKGKVTVYFYVAANTSSITLDLMSPLVTDSVIQRQNGLGFIQANNSLQINFNPAVPANRLDSVSIYYKGIPPNTGFGSFIQDMHLGTPVMWTLSEPYGARDWWPCKNGLDDKADSIDVIVTHPAIYKAASNGLLQSETINGTKISTHWRHRYPIATYLVCFAVTNYVVFNNSVQLGNTTLPMQTFCYPESQAAFQANTPKVLNAMALFNQYFGEYPFIREKYGHVQFGWGGGMEHQTSTFLINTNESLMAHELGHQWFGDKITTASWQDAWLNEGFATFLAAFHVENFYPASTIANRIAVINNIVTQLGGSVRVDDTTNVSRIFDGRLTYNKGAYLLYMLRFMLGDQSFFKGMKQYQQDSRLSYGFARTADFKRNMEQASGKDLTVFFNQWYTGEGYPTYHVDWSQLGNRNVRIRMNQVTSHPSVSFFEMPVALKFKNATQEKTVIVDNHVNHEMFVRDIGFLADTVLVDPDYWLISKNNSTAKTIFANNGQGALELYPNPVTGPLTIYLHDFNSTSASVQIFNAGGQLLYRKEVTLLNGGEIFQVSFASWPAGSYQVQVKSGNNTFVRQIIK
ncbi:MAG: type sorting protein [Ferruginibacter sp.]|nr:type sorting protein [Ferruginibacter sp.]